MTDRGLIDTSVLIDLESIEESALPRELAVACVTFAELAAGPHATKDPEERARRQDRLERAHAIFDPLPFDRDVARAYGRVYAAVRNVGRRARGQRFADLLIAATALSHQLPLYTRNPRDFVGLDSLLQIHPTGLRPPTRSRR